MQKKKNTHESLQKAFKILLSFTPDNREKTASELSRELGLHVSTTSRLLQVPGDTRLLIQDESTKKYSLGIAAFTIGNAVFQTVRDKMLTMLSPTSTRCVTL